MGLDPLGQPRKTSKAGRESKTLKASQNSCINPQCKVIFSLSEIISKSEIAGCDSVLRTVQHL